MPTTAEDVHDAAVLHRIRLSRYSTGLVRKVVAQLNRLELDLVARLARTDNESVSGQRLEVLIQEVRAIQAAGWSVVKQEVNTGVDDLAGNEAAFAERLVAGAKAAPVAIEIFSPKPSMVQIVAAVRARPFQGRILRDWLDGMEEGAAARVRDVIRQGFIEGRPTADIVTAIRGTRAAQFKNGVMELGRRGAEAMVRTAITHTASVAHEEVYRAHAGAITAVEWVSTLDSRTTLICASRDGNRYPIGKGPRPPAHIGCRSITVPVVGAIKGVAPFKRVTYEGWLRKQTADVQNEVLGPAKADLFRKGGLKLDRFVDRAGRELTLEQLRARDAEAFTAMGRAAGEAAKAPEFTSADLAAVEDYTSKQFFEVNDYLRGRAPASPNVLARVSAIDTALSKASTTESLSVFRGVDKGYAEILEKAGLSFGAEITDDAYLSTSMKLAEAEKYRDANGPGGLLMAIQAGPGQAGMDVSRTSTAGTAEREILFARGSRLKVVQWDNEARTLYLVRQPD